MMGATHAACGAAAWVALTATGPLAFGVHPLSPTGVVIGAIVCAGAALLPDIDHHNGTLAHCLPPVSRWLTRGVGQISGGHRHGTHSLLGVAVFTFLAWALGHVTVNHPTLGTIQIGAGLLAVILVACALSALGITRRGDRLTPWLLSLALAVVIAVYAPNEWAWLPLAVGVGTLVHIIGDLLTTGGVPLLWPITFRSPRRLRRTAIGSMWRPGGNIALPILGDAGSWREWVFAIPVGTYAAVGVFVVTMQSVGVDVGSWFTDITSAFGA